MAQNLQICQACDSNQRPKFKCLDCPALLCGVCNTNIHRFKINRNHKVMELTNIGPESVKESLESINLKDIPCEIHESERCIRYCEQCQVLICADCLIENHKSHAVLKIDQVFKNKLQNLLNVDTVVTQRIDKAKSLKEHIQKLKSEENADYKEARKLIEKQKNDIIERANKKAEKLYNEMDELWFPREKELEQTQRDTESLLKQLEHKKGSIEQIYASHNAANVFKSDITHDEDEVKFGREYIKQSILFSASQQNVDHNLILGSVVKVPKFSVVESIASDLKYIFKIKTLLNKENTLCLNDASNIYSFTLKESKIVTGTKVDIAGVIDMSILNKDTILFTVVASSEIKCINNFPPNTNIETYLSLTSDFYARGLHVNETRIFIGFKEKGKPFPLTEKSRRGIFIYDHKLTHIGTLKVDPRNQRLFSLPDVIAININGDICVVDTTNGGTWEGRLVVLREWGNLKWIYEGHNSINDKNKFSPMDVLTTSTGLILVTDYGSNAVHVLSMEGQLVTSLNKSHGIERPLALNIDYEGKLQIGCDSTGTKDGIAKLHVVEFQ